MTDKDTSREEEFIDTELDTQESAENTQEEENNSGTQCEEKLAEEKDRYVRLFAEFENYKKRTSKEKMEFFQYANQDIMIALLSVLDDFGRAIKELEKSGDFGQLEGDRLIYNKLMNILKEKGLAEVDVKPGDDFNVNFHEALTKIPAPSPELKDKVVDVLEKGYRLHDRVIRFAKVVIGD